MKLFTYCQPTEIIFGVGSFNQLGNVMARYGNRCLIVTTPFFDDVSPVYEKAAALIKAAGLSVQHFDLAVANPTTDSISMGANMAREFKADMVLGFGGGSSMDTAKAIAVEATHEGNAWDYLYCCDKQPTDKTLPIVAVPTTSGTGAHVTGGAVISNTALKCKSAISSRYTIPGVCIVDPELMLTMPPHLTATTGFDAFSHAFESYIHPSASEYTDLLAMQSMQTIIKNLPRVVNSGSDITSRTSMAWADTLAGLCIANTGVTLPHGIAMAIGGVCPHVMHGEALAAIYPEFMRFTYNYEVERFSQVAHIFNPYLCTETNEKAAEKSCEAMETFLKTIDMNLCLKTLNIPENELPTIAKKSMELPDYRNNPHIADLDDILEILIRNY